MAATRGGGGGAGGDGGGGGGREGGGGAGGLKDIKLKQCTTSLLHQCPLMFLGSTWQQNCVLVLHLCVMV